MCERVGVDVGACVCVYIHVVSVCEHVSGAHGAD